MPLGAIANRVRRFWHGRAVEVIHHPAYRLPLPSMEARTGVEPRRADFALWYLVASATIAPSSVLRPRRIGYEDLARVHTPELLDALSRPEALAAVYAVDPGEVRVDEVLATVRFACGGTLLAARHCLDPDVPRLGRRMLNLLGGFHHAGPSSAGGFCPVNDIAVALAVLRAEGFDGRVVVIDLDAHPPDGTAACLRDDPRSWIGSISGVDWGPLPNVDETVLPGSGDEAYLAALEALLGRMPEAQLAFVVAGGDVLSGDPLGGLDLTLTGVRRRDLLVSEALFRVPSVWLPGGGYGPEAWRVLAGTGVALGVGTLQAIPARYDPLSARYRSIMRSLTEEELTGKGADLNMEDIAEDLGLRSPRRRLLLGFYSADGLEHALQRYGVMRELRRLGYGPFRVELAAAEGEVGDRMQLFGFGDGAEHLLIETVVEKRVVDGAPVLYVHWLTLRNPLARFSAQKPRLPGQEVPGLGLAREATELLARMAERQGLDGVAFRPAAFHTAYAGRAELRFVLPERQGRFEALIRDLAEVPLVESTRAVAEGRLLMNGAPYAWEADEMVRWLRVHRGHDEALVAAERERVHFTLREGPAAGSGAA